MIVKQLCEKQQQTLRTSPATGNTSFQNNAALQNKHLAAI